jgi:hypothetical protein
MTTKDDREKFVSRWSRLKQEAREPPQQRPAEERREEKGPAPELPPVEKLTFDSDYRKFFHPKVGEDLRRAALKKLFSDPHFNVMDGLDVYIEDYSKADPIPAAMLAGMQTAQQIIEWAKGEEPERKPTERGESAPGEPPALAEQPRTDPAPGIEEPVRSAAVPTDRSEKA